MHATLESTADGLVVVDRHGHITGYNQKRLTLWRIPPAVAATLDDRQRLERVKDRLIDALPAFHGDAPGARVASAGGVAGEGRA